MPKSKFKMSALSRIYLVAVVAIVIPSLVLIYFGYQLIGEMQQLMGERQAKALREEVTDKGKQIENVLTGRENQLIEDIGPATFDPDDPRGLAARLSDFEKSDTLAEQFFLMHVDADLNYAQVYPERADAAGSSGAPAPFVDEDPVIEKLRLRGDHEEHVNKNPLAAFNYYAGRLDDEGDPNSRRNRAAHYDLAGACLKLGNYKAAAEHYGAFIKGTRSAGTDFSRLLLAKYQLPLVRKRQGDAKAAALGFLDLYEDIVEERIPIDGVFGAPFFEQKAVAQINTLAEAGALDIDMTRRYADLMVEARRKQRRSDFLDRLIDANVTRFKPNQPDAPDGMPPVIRHIHDSVKGEDVLIAYTFFWPADHDGSPWLLGFKVDLDYLKEELFSGDLMRTDLSICVLDAAKRRVWGDDIKITAEGVVTKEFPDVLSFWELAIIDPDPNSPLKAARKFSAIYTSLNLLVFMIILVGVAVTVKDMKREIEISRLKSDFVSNVSHELKTPLALIRMYAETLQMGRVTDEAKVRKYYDVIMRESEQLTWLINNILDFSRIESGRRMYEFTPGDIGEVVRETIDAYHYDLDQRGFDVELNVQPDLPMLTIDRNAISQAIVNLLNNAVKYSGDEKVIRVDVSLNGTDVIVAVSDRGIGVREEELEKIFDVFYRSSDTIVRRTKGTGLGLALVKHAAESHGGRISVESELGVGSKFTITLPIEHPLKS